MQSLWKVLGHPVITAEVREKMVAGVLAEAGGRSLTALAAQRDAILLALLKARAAE